MWITASSNRSVYPCSSISESNSPFCLVTTTPLFYIEPDFDDTSVDDEEMMDNVKLLLSFCESSKQCKQYLSVKNGNSGDKMMTAAERIRPGFYGGDTELFEFLERLDVWEECVGWYRSKRFLQ